MDRYRVSQDERALARARKPEPPAPVRAGSLEWASAVGNAAVARLARQTATAEPEAAAPEEVEAPESESSEAAAGPETADAAGAEAAGAALDPDAMPDELPE